MRGDERKRRGVSELPVTREQVAVEPRHRCARGAIADLVERYVGVPCACRLDTAVREPEDVAGQREHPVHHGVHREVLGDAVLLETELPPAHLVLVVEPVPGAQVRVARVGLEQAREVPELGAAFACSGGTISP